MDALERKVAEATSDIAKRYKQEQFLNRAISAWRITTGLEPAYAELLYLDSQNASSPKVVVEIDGIKIYAFQQYSKTNPLTGFHQWDIAERYFDVGFKTLSGPRLSLEALAPYLNRRRKRLQKRGMYESER